MEAAEATIYSISIGGMILAAALVAVVSYFLGCCNGAVLVSKYVLRDDIRGHGSGNAGLTNFYRTFGGKLTFAVIAADMVKMVVAVWVSEWILRLFHIPMPVLVKYWAGLFCMLGHMFPCMFHFRGGKGILSGGTLALMLDWRLALVVWGVFLIVAISTRLVSLGSCCAGVALPIMTAVVYQSRPMALLALCVCVLILWQHRGNIGRILKGKESKFSFHREVKP